MNALKWRWLNAVVSCDLDRACAEARMIDGSRPADDR
jgi:hypothetical protein